MDDFIRSVKHGDKVVVWAEAEIDLAVAATLRARLADLVDAGHTRLVIDLGEVTFIDSTGLGVLVGALKRTRAEGGDLVLVVRDGIVARILRISGLDRVFTVHASVADALAHP